MKSFKILVLLFSSVSLMQGYAASNFNYDYIEAGAASSDTKILGADVDGDILGVSGSFDLSENVNVLAGHQSAKYNFDLEGTQSTIGIGYHEGTAEDTDLYLEIFYLDLELAFPEGVDQEDVNEAGHGVNIGIRNLIGRRFEIDFVFSHLDIGSIGSNQTGFGFAGRYYFHRTFAIGLSYSTAEDTYGSGLGLRIGF